MLKIYLISLVLTCALAKFAINNANYGTPKNTADCYSRYNVTHVLVDVLNERGVVVPDFLASFINLRNANISNIDAIVRTTDSIPIERTCWILSHYLPVSFNGTVWFSVENRPNYWKLNVTDRVPFLENLTQTCSQHGLKTGVYSDAVTWAQVMGSQTAGSDKLRALPLWYKNENNQANFNDFSYATFGGWKQPSIKEYATAQYLCNYYIHGFEFEN